MVMMSVWWLLLPVISATNLQDPNNWWKNAVFYQIYPRSFMDTNGDGIGDLEGFRSHLDYLEYVGFGAAWLSPFTLSPQKDFGYDVQNYTAIDPSYGNMEEFDKLMEDMESRGLKLIMDFVPNHSSDQCEWFKKSKAREDPYTDYYVWVDGKGEKGTDPPNNWLGMFGGSAWEWVPERKQFFYHQFVKEQPDFNFRNPNVVEELSNVLRFWLDKGVAGFRIDAIKHLFEDKELRDEPPKHNTGYRPEEYSYLQHIYTTSQPEVLGVIDTFRSVLDEYEAKDGFHRVLLVEINETIANTAIYYGNETYIRSDIPFNFELFYLDGKSTGEDVYRYVHNWLDGVPNTKWSNWIIGNHDQHRIGNRTHPELIDAYNMINLMLKGTAVTYYGEELGMLDTEVTWEETQDPFGRWYGQERYKSYSRDAERTPMQWDDKKFAGFTKGDKTWLPVNPNYKTINVEAEKKDESSHLSTYRRLISLRKLPVAQEGEVHYPVISKSIFSFTRTLKDNPGLLIVVNFGSESETIDFEKDAKEELPFTLPKEGNVEAASKCGKKHGGKHDGKDKEKHEGKDKEKHHGEDKEKHHGKDKEKHHGKDKGKHDEKINYNIHLTKLKIDPMQAFVIKFEPKWKNNK